MPEMHGKQEVAPGKSINLLAETTLAGGPAASAISLPADLSFSAVIAKDLVIPRQTQGSWLDIIREGDRAAAIELLLDLSRMAPSEVNMRWAGGCKGFGPEDVEKLFKFLAAGHISADGERSFKGTVGSGGTMDINRDGVESIMICQVPYYLARLFPCVAWGSTPQTFRMRLAEDQGSPLVSKYGTRLDPRGHMNVLTQTDATHFQDWNGDVRWYIEALQSFARHGYKVAVGVVNGGDVTMDEALLALSKGIPVIVVEGTGRAADQLAAASRQGTVSALYDDAFGKRNTLDADRDEVPEDQTIAELLQVVHVNDPASLGSTMDKLGLLS